MDWLDSMKLNTRIHLTALPSSEVVQRVEYVGRFERSRCTIYNKRQFILLFEPLPFDESGDTIFESPEHKAAFRAFKRGYSSQRIFDETGEYDVEVLRSELTRLNLPSFRSVEAELARVSEGQGSVAAMPADTANASEGAGSVAASTADVSVGTTPKSKAKAKAKGKPLSKAAKGTRIRREINYSLRELGLVGRTPVERLDCGRTAASRRPFPCKCRVNADSTTLGVVDFMEYAQRNDNPNVLGGLPWKVYCPFCEDYNPWGWQYCAWCLRAITWVGFQEVMNAVGGSGHDVALRERHVRENYGIRFPRPN